MTISTSTATTYFSFWISLVRLIRCPGIRMANPQRRVGRALARPTARRRWASLTLDPPYTPTSRLIPIRARRRRGTDFHRPNRRDKSLDPRTDETTTTDSHAARSPD